MSDTPPWEGGEWIKRDSGKRCDGLPDGFHTGGVWYNLEQDRIYKPLDCKPWANSTERVPSNEEKALEALAGIPGILERGRWDVYEGDGRRWLVMPFMWFYPQHPGPDLELDDLLFIENTVRRVNMAGWEYGDCPQAARDEHGRVYLMDFSAAHKPSRWAPDCGDQYRMNRWWKDMGWESIAEIRRRGQHVLHAVHLPEWVDPQEEPYDVLQLIPDAAERQRMGVVYEARSMPVGPWADGYVLPATTGGRYVGTWVVTEKPLPDDVVTWARMQLAWEPWF